MESLSSSIGSSTILAQTYSFNATLRIDSSLLYSAMFSYSSILHSLGKGAYFFGTVWSGYRAYSPYSSSINPSSSLLSWGCWKFDLKWLSIDLSRIYIILAVCSVSSTNSSDLWSGREFLNCWARFSLIDFPLCKMGPPFLKHSICSKIKHAASILFSLVPFIEIMHSRASR